jgi:hypothetical protein
MLKIGLLSDIHCHRYEHQAEIAELIKHINKGPVPDLLILAGDLSHRTDEIMRFLGSIELDCRKCWIPGNHDIWVIEPEGPADSAEKRYRETFSRISAETGWFYLPAGPMVSPDGGFAVVGTLAGSQEKVTLNGMMPNHPKETGSLH